MHGLGASSHQTSVFSSNQDAKQRHSPGADNGVFIRKSESEAIKMEKMTQTESFQLIAQKMITGLGWGGLDQIQTFVSSLFIAGGWHFLSWVGQLHLDPH